MKLNRSKHKQPYVKSIITGFCALYLVSMLFSTYMIHLNYLRSYNLNAQTQVQRVRDWIQNISANYNWNGKELSANQQGLLRYALSFYPEMYDKYQPFSLALYDYNGNLVAQSCNLSTTQTAIPITTTDNSADPYLFYDLSEYVSMDELMEMAKYQEENYDTVYTENLFGANTQGEFPYIAEYMVNTDSYELKKIIISEATWDARDISEVPYLKDKNPIWQWSAKATDDESFLTISEDTEIGYFPYLSFGFSHWKNWTENEHLQQYAKTVDSCYESPGNLHLYTHDNLNQASITPLTFAGDSNMEYTYMLLLRHDPHPWLAAMDYMKFVYLWGLILTLVCIGKVLHVTEKTYKQQAALEETRRDFTNAVAHELKTPLSVIRGFAENLKEHTMEEKRDYYLEQIIGQTEEMDKLVQEMIYVSKLDSENLVLKKESVNLTKLVQKQFEKLDTHSTAKNLTIQYQCTDMFTIDGDWIYMDKALWNLASNAISYNYQNGTISVISEKDQLTIINTGANIPENELIHVFDMFYTGDKSRNTQEKHLGLGLYLVKKICTLHHLTLSITNVDDGIQVIISR